MELTYHPEKKAFVANCSFEEKDLAKGAGFRWTSIVERKWATTDPANAAKLITYADDEAKAMLQQIADERNHNLELSRSATLDVEIPRPDGLDYLPFQKAGIAFAQDKEAVLFGDEMGLGKTIQGIGFINTHPDIKRALIICPASLRLNWQRELEKWLVNDYTIAIADTKIGIPDTDIIIVNYDILHKLPFSEIDWDLVLLDEAHYIKNNKTQRAKAIRGDWNKAKKEWKVAPIPARYRIALTGTPIPNRPREAWSILNWLDHKTWPSYFGYCKRYANAQQTRWGWDMDGSSHLDELQDKLRSTVMVRRKKADVLKELPPKRRSVVAIPANGASGIIERERHIHEAHEEAMEMARAARDLAKAAGDDAGYQAAVAQLRSAQGIAFTEMAKVRAELAVAKAPLIAQHVTDIMDGTDPDYKVIVFAHHREVVSILCDALSEYGVVSITGDTAMNARQEAVDRFQTDSSIRVFVGNIQAAGVGLTLTASAHVVFAELDWTPANVMQAEDRAHRVGQLNSVLVEHIVFDESLDSKMAKIIVAKQAIIDAALDDQYTLVEPVTPADETESKPKTEKPALTADQINAVHEALRILAGYDGDHASELNGIGFNRYDGAIGHSLAEAYALTEKQAALGAKVVRKYRRQLPEQLMERITA